MIAASKELSEQLKVHWTTSLRQFAKATDRPLEVIPARYSAVRNDLASWHHAPSGLTPKTVMNHRSNAKRALLYLSHEKGIPEHGAPLTADWQELQAQVSDSLMRSRLSSFIRYCSANKISPKEVNETVFNGFMEYRNRCSKPANDAFRRLVARAWNANVGTIVEEAHNFIPSRSEGTDETPSLPTIRKMITEGRKFGTGLVLISQRPSRLDETTLAQCNSFLVLRLVNPADQRYVRQVMENLSEADARLLPTFGEGQGIVSGQAVRFPLLVQVKFDEELVSESVGDENFIARAKEWEASPEVVAKERTSKNLKLLKELNER